MADPMDPKRHPFPKHRRLLRRVEFVAAKERGQGFADGPLALSWLPPGFLASLGPRKIERHGARVGITVSSRVGGAVVRNRIKRLLREAVRSELSGLPDVDLRVEPDSDEHAVWCEQQVLHPASHGARFGEQVAARAP